MKEKVDDIHRLCARGGRMTGPGVPIPHSTVTPIQARDMEKRARRRVQLQVDDRERVRQKIQAERCVEQVWEISETLRKDKELGSNRIQALTKSAALKLSLLAKVVPDLKATEVSRSPEDITDPKSLTTAQLMDLIAQTTQKPPIVVSEAEYTEVPAPEAVPEAVQTPDW